MTGTAVPVIFCVLWFILAAFMVYTAFRLHRFLFVPALFFLFLGLWGLIDLLSPVNLMEGVYLWIYRAVSIVFLAVCGYLYWLYKKNGK